MRGTASYSKLPDLFTYNRTKAKKCAKVAPKTAIDIGEKSKLTDVKNSFRI